MPFVFGLLNTGKRHMKKSIQIRAELAAKTAEVQAIVELATAEKRDVNAEEKAVIDRIQGLGDEPGEIQALQSDLERAVRFESRISEISNNIFNPQQDTIDNPNRKSIIIPANARLHARLVAFSGPTAEQDAYITGRWVAANFLGHKPSKSWLKEHGIQNAMSESEDDRGGLFVPVETSLAIIRLVESYGVFRQFSSPESMASDRKVIPVRVSGLTATPVAETTRANEGSNTVTAQDVIYTNIELIARKWKIVLKMSDELNEDSLISMADEFIREAALAFAYAEDNAGFNGDATSTYHGILGVFNALAAGSIYTAIAGNTAFSTLDMADFESMAGRLPDYPGISPAWFISKEGYFASMHRLQMAANGNTSDNLAMGGRREFLSFPVVWTSVLNKTLTAQTSTKLLARGDLRMAAKFGDRRRMTMSLTDQRYWEEDQIGLKATERFDINIHSRGTATAAGAIVILQTPGA
jgi:HK97 family phage major capsid protein